MSVRFLVKNNYSSGEKSSWLKVVSVNRCLFRAVIFFLSLLFVFPLFAPLFASETIVVQITLNQQNKGDLFVQYDEENKDFLIRKTDLSGIGLTKIEGQTQEIGGEVYLWAGSLEGVSTSFDESSLILFPNSIGLETC